MNSEFVHSPVSSHPDKPLFAGFARIDCKTSRVDFAGLMKGKGPPLLLLHGYPQNHASWHEIAPVLSANYTVIVPDLPGYGNSILLDEGPWHKRAAAAELIAMMHNLGHTYFDVIGHDRGARVGYRLALDHPDHVRSYCSLAVVPTLDIWPAADHAFAMSAFHWFLFAQPGVLAERLLDGDPDGFLESTLERMAGGITNLHPLAVKAYRDSFRKPSVRRAMIEDYRSAYSIDVDHDMKDRQTGRRIRCPVLVLWAAERLVATGMTTGELTAADVWRRWADDVQGIDIECGHLLPEQAPEAVLRALMPFLAGAQGSHA